MTQTPDDSKKSLLSVDDPIGFAADITPRCAQIRTAYADYSVGAKESAQVPGKMETWFNFESRRAAELAFLSVNSEGNLCVEVMYKKYTKDGSLMYKIPGGYVIDENPEFHLEKKIEADTGIRLTGKPIYLGSTAGHPELVIPIGLFAALPPDWEKIGEPRPGITVETWKFFTALDFFDRHRLGDDHDLSHIFGEHSDLSNPDPNAAPYHVNETGFALLFRILFRLYTGELKISGHSLPAPAWGK